MSFDTLAPFYRSMESVSAGGLMQRCRTRFLSEVVSCRRALLLGEGPGRFLPALLQANSDVHVLCVEQSAGMIAESRERLNRIGLSEDRVTFQQCNALTWAAPTGAFDLISTHFFLDCFREHQLDELTTKIGAAAGHNAKWLLTDFRVPEHGWRRWRARSILALLYRFFRVATNLPASRLTPPEPYLERAGFRLANRHVANHGLIHSDLWLKRNGH